MISLPIPMALESFLQADILNILLHHWEKNSKGRSSFKFMTRLLLHQRESYSALWNSSQWAASHVQGEDLEKPDSSRALNHAESHLMSNQASCWFTGRRHLWLPCTSSVWADRAPSHLQEAPSSIQTTLLIPLPKTCWEVPLALICPSQHSSGSGTPLDRSRKYWCHQEWSHHKHITDISEPVSPFLSDISCQLFNCAVRAPDASEVWKLLHPHAWEMLLLFHRVVQWTEPLQTLNAETPLYLWLITKTMSH